MNSIVRNNCYPGEASNRVIFVGCGIAENDIPFSYQGDWFSPGRWGVEIMTSKHSLIFRPMENCKYRKWTLSRLKKQILTIP